MRTILYALFVLLLMTSASVCRAKESAYPPDARSAHYLYERCKEALESSTFEESYCAAYLEGYIGGGRVYGLSILAQADNQRELIDKDHRDICSQHINAMHKLGGPKWLARFFVGWMDSNQDIVGEEKAFLYREASTMLHTILTEERFCLKYQIGDEQ